jgi:hypothetical protein
MSKKPNAANITHGLAQLGGGTKKDGGGGMMQGMVNIFKTGYMQGRQDVIDGKDAAKALDEISKRFIGKK